MKKNEKPFYIGWSDSIPKENKSAVKKLLLLIFIGLPILAIAIVYSQKGFNNHIFDFGVSTALTGIYRDKPVPILEINPNDQAKYNSNFVLLVGYGKFGAEGIIKEMEDSNGSLNGKRITIEGTLLQGDGKTLLELTKEKESLIAVHKDQVSLNAPEQLATSQVLEGEILDPKCYFGVMKPGEGKIHKSCATRCISGGIPPILRVVSEDQKNKYFLILGEQGEKINHEILDKVAENTRISGQQGVLNGWDYIYANPQNINLIKED